MVTRVSYPNRFTTSCKTGARLGPLRGDGKGTGTEPGRPPSPLTVLMSSEVMALPCLSMAPSATMMMFSLEPPRRVWGDTGR